MISSQMNNPFMIGDLVHIPKGVVLYYHMKDEYRKSSPSPAKVNDKARVALVLKKIVSEFYSVSIGEEEYVVMKDDMSLVTRKGMR